MVTTILGNNSAQFVLANAGSTIKKVRGCYDGGSFKLLESHKTPCKLEGLPTILSMTQEGDKFVKLDDVKGFLLGPLQKESRDLAVIEFMGRFLMFWIICFGERKSPAVFQRINSIVVNFLRHFGFILSLYLDDRYCLERANLIINGKKISPSLGRTTFLSILVLIASGAYLNLEKSIFTPTDKEEFLGMHLNSKDCIISIPQDKLKRFRELALRIEQEGKCTLSELEILRGLACSFILAVKYLKLFIRQMTEAIRQVNLNFPNRPHPTIANKIIFITPELRAELREWRKCTILTTEQCWLPTMKLNKKYAMLYTDASEAQAGAVLYIEQTKVATWKIPFPETTHNFSIARLETLTILLAVVEFRRFLRNKLVINLCDNQNSVWAFDKDGSRDPTINDLVIRIIDQIRLLKSDLQVIWLPTAYQLADAPSRDICKSEEFLPQCYFDYIETLAGTKLAVDCLATQANSKCPEYIGLKPTELEKVPFFQNKEQIFLNFLETRRRHLSSKTLYLFPPKSFLAQVASHLSKHFWNHPFVLLFHRFEEIPLAISPLLRHPNSKLVLITNKKAITYFPAEKTVDLIHLPNGQPLKNRSIIRGQPNIRPRALMAVFHCCHPPQRLVKGQAYWYDAHTKQPH